MTGKEVLKRIFTGKTCAEFLYSCKFDTDNQVYELPEYKENQVKILQMEEEFKGLYADKQTGTKQVLEFNSLRNAQEALMGFKQFESGFLEGFLFVVGLLTDNGTPEV